MIYEKVPFLLCQILPCNSLPFFFRCNTRLVLYFVTRVEMVNSSYAAKHRNVIIAIQLGTMVVPGAKMRPFGKPFSNFSSSSAQTRDKIQQVFDQPPAEK